MNDREIMLIGISGSPRVASTAYAVEAALRYAAERYPVRTEFVHLHNKQLHFCIHCDFCRKKKGCVHNDSMTGIYPLLEKADAWILGSPVYQGHMSGQLKTFLDRLRASVARDPEVFTNKVGAGIAVGGDRNGGQEPTLQSMIDFYLINKMIPAGGGFFGANLGAAFWSKDRRAKGAEEDAEGIRSVHRVVDRLMSLVLRVHHRE